MTVAKHGHDDEQDNSGSMASTAGSRPVPDPTILTTQAVDRGKAEMRDLFDTRLAGVDKALYRLQKQVDDTATLRHEAVLALQELHAEKFAGEALLNDEKFKGVKSAIDALKELVQKQIGERDNQTDKTAKANKDALDAALQAAKEAVGEQNKSTSEKIAVSTAGFTKQIDQIIAQNLQIAKAIDDKVDQIKSQNAEGTKNTNDKIDETKSRINTIESRVNGTEGQSKIIDSLANRLNALEIRTSTFTNTQSGHTRGVSESWGVIATIVAMLAGLAAVATLAIMLSRPQVIERDRANPPTETTTTTR